MKKYYKIVDLENNTYRNDIKGLCKVNLIECENIYSPYGYYVAENPYAAIRYGYSLFGGNCKLFCLQSDSFRLLYGKIGKVTSYKVVEEIDIKELISQKLSDDEISCILEGQTYDINFVLKNIDVLYENMSWRYRVSHCKKIGTEEKIKYGFSKDDCKQLFSRIK